MATLILYPESDYSIALGTFGDGAYHYDRVYESTPDDTDGVSNATDPGNYQTDKYGLPDHSSQTGIISDITIYARAWATQAAYIDSLSLGLRTYSTDYFSTDKPLSVSPAQYSQSFSVNPYTGVAWTWAEVDALMALVALKAQTYYPDKSPEINPALCSQILVVITYTPPSAPAVTTQAASDVTSSSCSGNGNVTNLGGATVTRRGFCYMAGTSGDPTTANSVAYDDGSFGTGAFTKGISGLSPGTTYRVRAYAVNSAGTGYGATVSVDITVVAPTVTTQAASDLTASSCSGNGNVTNLGGATVTRRGFCYMAGTSGDPTTANSVAYDDGSFGTGAFTKGISGLSPGTTYRVRAYAVNSAGTGYGATVSVDITVVAPTVTTQAASDVTSSSCTGNGNVTSMGGSIISRHGFCYMAGTTGDPTTADSVVYDGSFGTGAFTKGITGLSPGTTYRVRAYAVNSAGTGYGATVSVTPDALAPTVTTQAATAILPTSCTGNGNITATGGENASRRGFCYMAGSTGDPTTADNVAYDDGDFGTGAFTKSITGLSPGTTYRVRAYAVNSAGIGYGATVSVITSVVTPTVTTQAASAILPTSCTGNGNITATGGENASRRGFCYMAGSTGDPTTADSVAYDDGSFGTGAFTKSITGLSPDTDYRARAYAVNSAGTSYGLTVSLKTTNPCIPDPLRICPACKAISLEDSTMYEDVDICPACGASFSVSQLNSEGGLNNV